MRPRSTPAELVQAGVVDADVMTELVHNRNRDLLRQFVLIGAELHEGPAKQRDLIGQSERVVRVALGQRDAVIETEQSRLVRIPTSHSDHDVVEHSRDLIRQPIERIGNQLLETRLRHPHHVPQSAWVKSLTVDAMLDDGAMPDVDLLADAITTLYRTEFDDFVSQRSALVAQARKAGDRNSAQAIAKLKKPTRSAWIINHFVHADPEVPIRLADLANRLRAAERALDGAQMRSLTTEKNRLLAELTRAAFVSAEQLNPTASVAEEVTSTLAAALADPAVAESLSEGTLLRSASWSGFGVSPPELTLVRSPVRPTNPPRSTPNHSRGTNASRVDPSVEADVDAGPQTTVDTRRQEREAAELRAEQEQRAKRIQAAEEAVALADTRVADADEQQSSLGETVARLSEELTTARNDLKAAGLALREARSQRQTARQNLSRLRA
ncbi:MAG: hypothetical protein JWM76_2548 [Pseudonocardiales bacterium]|nr:hypothetical protein [Pseudonocardiales bacterium]